MIPEERAAELIGHIDDSTSTEDLQQMIADAIRDAVRQDREKSGRTYHFRRGEKMVIACYACGGENSAGCKECGGAGTLTATHGGEAGVWVRRTGKEIPSPEEVLEHFSLEADPTTTAALADIEGRAREYCASLFEDLAARGAERECFGMLDDDEYSRRAFSSALGGYAHHVRTYFGVKAHDRRGVEELKELFRVAYRTKMEVRQALSQEFERHREFDYALMMEMGEDIGERIAGDDVLEHLSEAVRERMIQIFYRGVERRLADLKERGVPVDEEMVRQASG